MNPKTTENIGKAVFSVLFAAGVALIKVGVESFKKRMQRGT